MADIASILKEKRLLPPREELSKKAAIEGPSQWSLRSPAL